MYITLKYLTIQKYRNCFAGRRQLTYMFIKMFAIPASTSWKQVKKNTAVQNTWQRQRRQIVSTANLMLLNNKSENTKKDFDTLAKPLPFKKIQVMLKRVLKIVEIQESS